MEKKKPQIRFNGFEGEWATTTLGACSKKITTKNNGNEYKVVLTNSAERGIVDQRSFFDREIVNTENIQGYYIVSQDDFVYNPRISMQAPVGPINRSKIEYTGVMSPLYYVFRITDKRFSLTYLEWFFKSSSWHDFMYTNGNSGARSDRFSINDDVFLKLPIYHSKDISEQEKIGVFLTTLDKLIAKLEAKLDKLRKLKQALLEKMFINVNVWGDEAPQIRFKGYTDKWQVKELREVFEMPTSRISDSELQADQYISTEHILQNFEGVEPSSSMPANLSAIRFFRNDILMANIRPYLKKIWLSDRNGGASSDVIVFRITVKSDPAFLYYELTNGQFIGYVMESVQGSKMPRGNKQAMQTFKMSIAPLSEQQQIGKYLVQMDVQLSKTSIKLTKLRNIKQSLLQKMFA